MHIKNGLVYIDDPLHKTSLRQSNMSKILHNSILPKEDLQELSNLDSYWFNYFYSKASLVSSEHLAKLWAALLDIRIKRLEFFTNQVVEALFLVNENHAKTIYDYMDGNITIEKLHNLKDLTLTRLINPGRPKEKIVTNDLYKRIEKIFKHARKLTECPEKFEE